MNAGRGDAPPLEIGSDHRGALPLDGGPVYAIDIAEASLDDRCHYHHGLVRRVQTGG